MDGLDPADPGWIGGYRLLGRLGEGGMGRVYLARSERGRTVAVKVVKEELARKPDFRRRFTQEVKAARRVGGDWTAPVLDADTEAATPWVATGYVAGPSLSEVVDKQYGPLPATSVRALAIGLIRALQAIHGAGLVHRDLKPSNVLVTIDGPRVIDFGIARALDTATQSGDGLTMTGALVGSPGFMSPEQVRGERVTFASDVFCLGAVLAYTVTGRLPFGAGEGGIHSLLFRIASEEAELQGIPEPWHALIAACLEKDPAQRPTLDSLLTSIDGFEGAEGTGGAWLPGEVLAELGRHAVQLLNSEDPQSHALAGQASGPGPGAGAVRSPAAPAQGHAQSPAPAHSPVPGFGPPVGYDPSTPPWQNSPPPGSLPPAGYQPGGFHQGGLPPGGFHRSGPHTPHHSLSNSRNVSARSTRGLATALTVLLALYTLPLLFRSVVLELAYIPLTAADSTSDPSLIADFENLRLATMASEILDPLVGVVVVIVWSFWFQRTRNNAEAFEPGRVRHSLGLAAGSWFIPVVNLYMPKQIGNDVWTVSTGRPTGAGRWLLHTWWWSWLFYVLTYLNDSISSWYDEDFAVGATDDIVSAQITNLVGFVTAVLAILFVNRLTSIQRSRMAGGA
ncbi:protein kinase [Streptomyces sp. NPDC050988]|uniref:protein kinase domain-containing protein n=1 Tax=Streptomyces sp. NPDC050988 TaxID=3365637 RepID=UPI0037AB5593